MRGIVKLVVLVGEVVLSFARLASSPWRWAASVARVMVIGTGVTLVLSSASCAPVPVYARGRLAHRTMSPTDGVSAVREHVYDVREGAIGGSSLHVSSGCGCN